MKIIITTFLCCCVTVAASAQTVSIGLRDNQYAHIQYVAKTGLLAEVEQSLFMNGVNFQHIQGFVGYRRDFNYLNGDVRAYYGTTYGSIYQDYGLKISAETTFSKRWGIGLALNPHEDSDYGYTTCYVASVFCSVFKEIAIELSSTNIPEYRQATNRLKAGLRFHSGNLYVKPQISIPTEGNIKYAHVLCGFDYTFQ
ncbi:hypothetical protein AGMMS49982_11990 [Bacteroidia bacterium]|nr:hypothetical protein AGMMS49982_11990 [Bacteroidia bacterium]